MRDCVLLHRSLLLLSGRGLRAPFRANSQKICGGFGTRSAGLAPGEVAHLQS